MFSFTSCVKNPIITKDVKPSIDEIMANLSLEAKVGQLFVFSISDDHIDDATAAFLQNTRAGNIILYNKNIKDPNQIIDLNKSLQNQIIRNTKLPAFIGIDQEGGQITRLSNGEAFFPGAMACSAAGDPDVTYKQGQYMGQELKALGINMDFAPVVDINSNPQNPVINTRAYGDNPDTVSSYSAGMIKGLQEQNVIACVKHFPGHGDTITDSHYSLPTINKSLDDLKQMEFIPFQKAVDNGTDAIMTAHITFPQIESNNLPATLSKTFLTDILRNQMNFNGLIVTDSLKMNAISSNYGIGEAAVMAVNAGANLLITGSGDTSGDDISYQSNTYASVLAAVKSGMISQDTLYQRVKLVLQYKEKYGLLDNPFPKGSETVDWEAHQNFADEVSLNSMTLMQNKLNLLPISQNTLVISNTCSFPLNIDKSEPGAKNSFAYLLARKIGSNYMTLPNAPTPENIQAYAKAAKDYDTVVVAVNSATQAEAVHRIISANSHTIVVSLGSPYDLSQFKKAGALLCAYEYTSPAVNSLLKVLTGEAEAKGTMPVKLQ